MTRVFADDTDNALAADNAAKFAERFDRGTDTHTEERGEVSLGENSKPRFWKRGAGCLTQSNSRASWNFIVLHGVFRIL